MAVTPPRLCGIVLAAGAGSRRGAPKALAYAADGTPWVVLAERMLRAAGCTRVLVALGAAADQAMPLVPDTATVVIVDDWADGVSATLRAALIAAGDGDGDAALVAPVDTPDARAEAAARVVSEALAATEAEVALAQAVYHGRPGHPVLIGRAHWAAVAGSVSGDSGARRYLVAHAALEVECADLWSGEDIDT